MPLLLFVRNDEKLTECYLQAARLHSPNLPLRKNAVLSSDPLHHTEIFKQILKLQLFEQNKASGVYRSVSLASSSTKSIGLSVSIVAGFC